MFTLVQGSLRLLLEGWCLKLQHNEHFGPQLKTKDCLGSRGVILDWGTKWLRSLVSQEQHQVLYQLHIFMEEAFFCPFPHMNSFFPPFLCRSPFSHFHLQQRHFPQTNFLSFHVLKTVTFPSKLSDTLSRFQIHPTTVLDPHLHFS